MVVLDGLVGWGWLLPGIYLYRVVMGWVDGMGKICDGWMDVSMSRLPIQQADILESNQSDTNHTMHALPKSH